MKLRKLLFIASLLTAASSPAYAAAEFSNFVLFGDSLSDIGNGAGSPYTNNGGPLWLQDFNNQMGMPPVVASSKGGLDYAVAGDYTGPQPYPGPADGGQLGQVETFVAGNNFRINSNSLYSLWAGANDISDGLLSGTSAGTIISNANGNIIAAAELLQKAGAKYLMVINIPNLGNTPAILAYGPTIAADFTAVTLAFNQTLNSKLNALPFPVIQPDAYGLLSYVQTNPTMFGFSGPYGSVCDSNGLNCTKNPSTDIFYDGYHPSVNAGAVLAGYILSIFQGAQDYGIMGEAPFAVLNEQDANLDSELLNIRTGTESVPVGHFKAFVSGSYNPYDLEGNGTAQPGFIADNWGITAGVDYRLNPNTVVGAAVGHEINDIDFDNNGGKLNLNENVISLFGGYQYDQAYATAELNYGVPEFNLNRNLQMGIAQLSNHGSTDGLQYGADGTIGFNVIDNALKTGPYLNLTYQNVHVNGFQESGIGNFADLNYESEFDQSFTGGIGWQVAYCGTSIYNIQLLPYAQASFNRQFINGDRTVFANPVSANGGMGAFPFIQPEGNFVVLGGGIQGVLSNNVSMTLGYDASLSNQNNNDSRAQDVLLNLAVQI